MPTKSSQKEATSPNWKWIARRDGQIYDLYANMIHASWTLYDVRLRFGQLIPTQDYTADFVIEEQATVTMSWHEAKIARDALNELIARYEKTNGELKALKLVPSGDEKAEGV